MGIQRSTNSHLQTPTEDHILTVGANIMFPCEVRSSRTSPEVRTKLRRSSYEVGTKLRRSSYEVGRRLYEVEAKFVRS